MNNYGMEYTVDKWNASAAWFIKNIHPSLVIAIFMLLLQHAIGTDTNPYVSDWIETGLRQAFGVTVSRETWQVAISLCLVIIVYARTDPFKTVLLSLPAGMYTFGVLLYGISHGVSNTTLLLVGFTWFGVGGMTVMMVAAGRAAAENLILIEAQKAQRASEKHPASIEATTAHE